MPAALSQAFTPFGYLHNPAHRASSWAQTSGGNLRTAPDRLGVEWAYPVGRDPTTRVGLDLETVVDGRVLRTRAEFDALNVRSHHHSCFVIGFDWTADGVSVEARYFLAAPDALCVQLTLRNETSEPRSMRIGGVGRVDDHDSADRVALEEVRLADAPCPHVLLGGGTQSCQLGPHEEQRRVAVLARASDVTQAMRRALAAASSAERVYRRLLADDAQFESGCPSLAGDWPANWREGLHYDFQATRSLVQAPGGVFADVWPSWMAAWPRIVLAEGTLDMLRLAYADPALAQRAVLSLFRDAPAPNVPCMFENGEYNMLAADGSPCGTSPAWCLPFLSLELLYLRTLDRTWLGQLYPCLSAYIAWWLRERVDGAGWLVYKCTWESGEDGNPRLDPTGTGDADISGRVRPVELQASLAHAAAILAFFASQLGHTTDVAHWQAIERDYRDRTRQLFDAEQGRYRDWLIVEQRFSDASPDQLYWGIQAGRYSAQSLTPLLIGEPLPEDEVWRHAGPPWTLWPSWTISVVESAAAAGLYAGVGQLAFDILDHVYRTTTRHELGSLARPMPGAAPEFWPLDWSTYAGNDGYGWGATTANLLIRHLFGFKESRDTDGWVAELTPALPPAMLKCGRRYGIRNLTYRGLIVDLWYVVEPRTIQVHLETRGQPKRCQVHQLEPPTTIYPGPGAPQEPPPAHTFRIQLGKRYTVRLF